MGLLTCFAAGDRQWEKEFRKDHRRLRYEALLGLDWDVFYDSKHRQETDEYDFAPGIVYFVIHDDNGFAQSVLRMGRTDIAFSFGERIRTYMLRDVFDGRANPKRNLFYSGAVAPCAMDIRELSRLVVAKELQKPEGRPDLFRNVRRQLVDQHVLGCLEYARDQNVHSLVFLSRVDLWEKVWIQRGLQPQWLGPEVWIDNTEWVRAGRIEVTPQAIEAVRKNTGLRTAGLFYSPLYAEEPASMTPAPHFPS